MFSGSQIAFSAISQQVGRVGDPKLAQERDNVQGETTIVLHSTCTLFSGSGGSGGTGKADLCGVLLSKKERILRFLSL